MENETKYKFEPLLISGLSLILILCFYRVFTAYNPNASISLYLALIFPVFFVSCFIFPLAFSMVRGIPAIALTGNYFIINVGGHSIEWDDIMEMHLTKGNYQGASSLVINLREPKKYFNTPLKSILYTLKQLFTANDIAIPLNVIAGNNDEIFHTANVYWTRYSESHKKH